MNQEESEAAVPEAVDLLKANSQAQEIVVEAAAPLRNAEANGNYSEILKMLS